ncbi:IST1 homolog [Seminavis robusta]|uniref:IST1 homolog n=1 Tax=Seminavis robusta TaxID=568900 RepID=A0A9N8HEK2_9STRA|nr:IST1 homolog [Seminavis robusta]|eukprot:Sro520_g159100.1 IST1 homolog (615) ;mRNA; r:11427-13271
MFSRGSFDATKLKAALKLASSRFDVAKNKKMALMKQNMREVAVLLAEDPPKEEKARIRTERLIKDDYLIEAYEILQLECQLLVERVQLIKHLKMECPPDLVPCVSDLIYAAPRVDIPELQEIKQQLVAKFGKTLAMDADNNKDGVVNPRIVEKLSLSPPTAFLVQNYMTKIAKLHQVSYEPTLQMTLKEALEPIAAPIGYSVPVAMGTGLGSLHVVQEPQTSMLGTAAVPSTNPDFNKETLTEVKAFPCAPQGGSLLDAESTNNKMSPFPPANPTEPACVEEKSNQADPDFVQSQLNITQNEVPDESTNIMDYEHVDCKGIRKDSLASGDHSLPRQLRVPHAAEQDIPDTTELYGVLTGLSLPVAKQEPAGPKQEPKAIGSFDFCDVEDEDMKENLNHATEDHVAKVNVTHRIPSIQVKPTPESTELEFLRKRFQALATPLEDTKNLDQSCVRAVDPWADKLYNSKNPGSSSFAIVSHIDAEQADTQEDCLWVASSSGCGEENKDNTGDQVDLQENEEKCVFRDAEIHGREGEETLNTRSPRSNNSLEEYITGAAIAGGAVGFVVAGSFGGILGAAGVAHLAANKNGKAADMARKCGEKVSEMTGKLVQKMEQA